jgi:hypothetical protein
MPEPVIRVTLDIRPSVRIDPGPVFERIQRLLEDSNEFDILGGSAHRIVLGEVHPHDTDAVSGNPWPVCALCGMDSNFALNGNVQTLCYDHHPSGRSSTPIPDHLRIAKQSLGLDTCDRCGNPSDELAYAGRDGFDFLCPTCRFLDATDIYTRLEAPPA